MKILYIVHDYWPECVAGTENYTHYLAGEMAKKGHQVFVFTTKEVSDANYNMERYVEDNGVNVIKVCKSKESIRSIINTYEDIKIERIFRESFDNIEPDIVHVQHLLNLSWNIVKIVKEKNIPVLYTLHDFWIECFNVNRVNEDGNFCSGPTSEKCEKCYVPTRFLKKQNIFDRVFLKMTRLSGFSRVIAANQIKRRNDKMKKIIENVDLFISPSNYLRNEFLMFGISEKKIIYMRNGMHVQNSNLNKEEKKKEKVTFVFTSHIKKIKGVDVLLDACQILQQNNVTNVDVCLYGKVSDNSKKRKEFLDMVDGLDNVEYCGSFDNTKIGEILSHVDYLILPSIWAENAPLVIDEAYLNSVPCIVSNIGGMAERVDDGVNGLHFKVGNAKDLADKMQKVARERGLRENFIKNIPHVKTIEENAKELERIYQNMIK